MESAGQHLLHAIAVYLDLPENCVIVAVIRQGNLVVPRGSMIFQTDDEVLALTDAEAAECYAVYHA